VRPEKSREQEIFMIVFSSEKNERRMLRLTASLAGGVPAGLREALSGPGQRNLDLLITAIRHACGQPPGTGAP
jgi:hypothetical protein